MSTRGASLGMPGASCVLHVCAPKKFDATSENYLVVELEKEFCRAKAAEVRLTRLAEKMQRALEALRFEAATQANAHEREQHQCCSCYKVLSVSAVVLDASIYWSWMVTSSVPAVPIVLRMR
jgi:hypothetical protein